MAARSRSVIDEEVAPVSDSRSHSHPDRTDPAPGDAATIVVIEDEHAQQIVLQTALSARGHVVHVAGTGAEGLDLAAAVQPDVIVLDLGLPDVDGVHLCRHLRNVAGCPIVVVTSDVDEARVVEALDNGADDYITKPFAMAVLLARLRVALRHRNATAGLVDHDLLTAGDLALDLGAHQLTVAGEPIDMHARQFSLLAILVRNQGRVVTYSAIGRATGVNTPDAADRNSWRVSISKIRKQIGTGPSRPVIETELNVGYRLVVPGTGTVADR
jgi:two-component system, OmpR family, KDP operon response regulator KdpE